MGQGGSGEGSEKGWILDPIVKLFTARLGEKVLKTLDLCSKRNQRNIYERNGINEVTNFKRDLGESQLNKVRYMRTVIVAE